MDHPVSSSSDAPLWREPVDRPKRLGYYTPPMKKILRSPVNPHAQALGRLGGLVGGKSRSRKKVAAARRNGAKGGRPRIKRP
jgi:hypothetical protein